MSIESIQANVKNSNLSEKVILITGAAGQLGKEIAKMFDVNNSSVILCDTNLQSCKDIENELVKGENNSHLSLELDVSSEESAKSAFSAIKEKYNKVDVLINNAAIAVFTDMESRTKAEFMEVLEVNTFGPFNCIQKFMYLMKDNKNKSSIINIASIYGCVSSDPRIYNKGDRKNSEIYSISKAGVIQMTKYLAVHLASMKIRVNSISPGGIYNNHNNDFEEKYSNRVPLKKMAKVEEILGTILFLADNNMSSYITGQNILVDGGLTSL